MTNILMNTNLSSPSGLFKNYNRSESRLARSNQVSNALNNEIRDIESTNTIKGLTKDLDTKVGAHVTHYKTYDPMHIKTFHREFDTMVLGWETSWGVVQPEQDRYQFYYFDNLINMAEDYNITILGDSAGLVWHVNLPEWLAYDGGLQPHPNELVTDFNRSELLSILDDYLEAVVGRYKGKVYSWTVVNEATCTTWSEEEGWYIGPRKSFWYETIGADYIAYAFNKTHEIDPNAKLFINDGIWWNNYPDVIKNQSDYFYNFIVNLLEQGVPLHGIGLQMHLRDAPDHPWIADWLNFTKMEAYISRLHNLGLEIHLTESDVSIVGGITNEKLQRQAEIYQWLIDIAMKYEHITYYNLFGITDKHSLFNAAEYIFDEKYEPKPAYYAIKHRLQGNTELYQHDFDDPYVNPPPEIPPDLIWGLDPILNNHYEILTANYNDTSSWKLIAGNTEYGELEPGNLFWVNITHRPDEEVHWNYLDYWNIDIGGEGFYWTCAGDYSFYDRFHFIRGVPFHETPEWLRQIVPNDSRLTWDDITLNIYAHRSIMFRDGIPEFTNNDTSWGYYAKSENFTIHMIWNKTTGILEYYHYIGSKASGLPLEIEFILQDGDYQVIPPPESSEASPESFVESIVDTFSEDTPEFEWFVILILIPIGLYQNQKRKKK